MAVRLVDKWCEIMMNGDEKACEIVEEKLNNGLGSALRKLYAGLNGESAYKDY